MLLKGVNKRVIIIKNPESEIFEEAYFIVKSGKGFFKQAKENEMVMEANRIISDYSRQHKSLTEKEKHGKPDKPDASDISDKSNIANIADISDMPDKSDVSDNSDIAGNISGMTAEIDRFLNDKIQKLEKPGNKNKNKDNKDNKKPQIPQETPNPNLISDLPSLKDLADLNLAGDEIFDDENFLAGFENPENSENSENIRNAKNNKNNSNNSAEPDYYAHPFDYLPTSIISDISNVSSISGISGIPDIHGITDIYGSKPKFKLISAKNLKKPKKFAFSLPPKSFFAGIGFMSAVVIAVRILEFILSK